MTTANLERNELDQGDSVRSFFDFVAMLAKTAVSPNIANPYHGNTPFSQIRRQNLLRYLKQMNAYQPTLLLVGEAPGHRGCRLTGVPFVSEQLLLEGVAGAGWQLLGDGYVRTGEVPQQSREASSTILWQSVCQAAQPPLIWNALPFHPHKPDNPWSNRTPKTSELRLGEPFLRALLALYPIAQVAAVGNKAAGALERWGITAVKVRHPSYGGKKQFVEQMARLLV